MNSLRAIGTAFLVTSFCFLSHFRADGADLTAAYQWKQMKIGDGEWIVDMDTSPTEKGVIFCCTDVSGAYPWNAATSTWKQIVTAETMPKYYVRYGRYSGVDSLVTAPKAPGIAYMAFKGQIFRSTNRGYTWNATTFASHNVNTESNGEGRREGERLGVAPSNSDVVYFCPTSDFTWVTEDGGSNWHKVDGLPAGIPPHGINTVKFDKGGGTTQSKTSAIKTDMVYVTIDQTGILKSADAGATWTNIGKSGPGIATKPRDASIGPDRTYYLASHNESGAIGSVWKCTPAGVWTNITPPAPQGGSQAYWGVAFDPTDANHVVVIASGGNTRVLTDQGVNWTCHSLHLDRPNILWLGKQENYWLSVDEIAFDPFDRGKLWFAEGFGFWWTVDLTTPEIHWNTAGQGIEEACANEVIAPPVGKPVAAMFNLGAFYFNNPDTYTALRSQPYLRADWALDWCPANPQFIVGVFRNNLNFPPHLKDSGLSTDGGRTWNRFSAVETNSLPAIPNA